MNARDAAITRAVTWAAQAIRTESREFVAVVLEVLVEKAEQA